VITNLENIFYSVIMKNMLNWTRVVRVNSESKCTRVHDKTIEIWSRDRVRVSSTTTLVTSKHIIKRHTQL